MHGQYLTRQKPYKIYECYAIKQALSNRYKMNENNNIILIKLYTPDLCYRKSLTDVL